MLFVPHLPLHSNIAFCSELFVNVNFIFLFTLLCVAISHIHYLYYHYSFYCWAGFVLALGCYLPSPIMCIYIKLIEMHPLRQN